MRTQLWKIKRSIIDETSKAFSSGKHEVFVLWTADLEANGSTLDIRRCIVPKQKPGFTRHGAYVHIEGSELSRVQFDNFDQRERSVVQLHTHPSADVRMSDLDREWEVVKHVGALSIIVPSYGKRRLIGFPGVNVYERVTDQWRLWSREETEQKLRVIP